MIITHRFAVSVAFVLGAVAAEAAPITHHSDFIPDGSRSAFAGFEGLPDTATFGASYTEAGFVIDQINGQPNDIWTNCGGVDPDWCLAQEGARSWYPNGGDNGYTRVKLAGNTPFDEVGFFVGSGYDKSFLLFVNYEVLLGGVVQLASSVQLEPDGKNYLGFSGGGFDEIRLTSTLNIPRGVTSGTYQALQLDSLEIGGGVTVIPEPASLLLLGIGLVSLGCRLRTPRR